MVVAQGIDRRSKVEGMLAQSVEKWFQTARRDLPWRRNRTPYGTLVSEAMLQQTQVARVCPAWKGFLRKFPTVRSLAAAPEDFVLEAWQGLGFYRRARNLHAAAKVIVEIYRGKIPTDRAALEKLPGIGPYCAGAIASIAFGQREAIVDGNVARVMMRIHGRNVDADSIKGKTWLWNRARDYVNESRDPAQANEGLMELGATICTPVSPSCGECPVRLLCAAHAAGAQNRIPLPRRRAVRTVVHAQAILAVVNGKRALVRRESRGLWAGLMFPPTIESPRMISRTALAKRLGVESNALSLCGSFTFLTTHRSVRFRVWNVDDAAAKVLKKTRKKNWTWHAPHLVEQFSITSAMREILVCATASASGKSGGKRVTF